MTKYIGNVPFVGKKKTIAFESFCKKCKKKTQHSWINPYGKTINQTLIIRLFSTRTGFTCKGITYSFHTLLCFLKMKKVVEVAACEECGQVRVKCLHCGNIEIFTNWQEVYICSKCRKKSYMFANHPQKLPFWFFEWE